MNVVYAEHSLGTRSLYHGAAIGEVAAGSVDDLTGDEGIRATAKWLGSLGASGEG